MKVSMAKLVDVMLQLHEPMMRFGKTLAATDLANLSDENAAKIAKEIVFSAPSRDLGLCAILLLREAGFAWKDEALISASTPTQEQTHAE